jgi:hypothetical protein
MEEFRRTRVLPEITKLFQNGSRRGMLRKDVDPEIFTQMFLVIIDKLLVPEFISTSSHSASDVFRSVIVVMLGGVLTDDARQQLFLIENSPRI